MKKIKNRQISQVKQLALMPKLKDVFVGTKRGTHAKSHRPLDSRKPIHVCFRSKFATGKRTMLGVNQVKVHQLVRRISDRFDVRVVKYANVGNHLHLVVKLPGTIMTARRHYAKWVRLLTSRLAFEIGGSKKGRPFVDAAGKRSKFWDSIPFSRVIHGQQGWNIMSRYVLKNEFESQGHSKVRATELANLMFDSSRALELPNWKSTA